MPSYPDEDSKLRASSLSIRRGGNCPNSLEVLEQLLTPQDGIQPYLLSCLPSNTSAATRRIISSFGQDSRVDFSHCIYRRENTEAASSYIIRSEATGSRTLVNYNDLQEMTVQEFEAVVRGFCADQDTWWHFEVCHAVRPAHFPFKCGDEERLQADAAHSNRVVIPILLSSASASCANCCLLRVSVSK